MRKLNRHNAKTFNFGKLCTLFQPYFMSEVLLKEINVLFTMSVIHNAIIPISMFNASC